MIKIIVLSLMLVGCSHFGDAKKELEEKEKQQFLYDFSSSNQRVSAEIKLNSDLTKTTIDQYIFTLSAMKGQKAVDTVDRLKKFDIKEVRSDSKYLYICVYSEKYSFGACDSTKCSDTEIVPVVPTGFAAAFEKLKVLTCNNSSAGNGAENVSK